jgi:solute carrier family 35, member F3/4
MLLGTGTKGELNVLVASASSLPLPPFQMYFGVCVTVLITFFWVGTTHCFKFLFLPSNKFHKSLSTSSSKNHTMESVRQLFPLPFSMSTASTKPTRDYGNATISSTSEEAYRFNAPFFASWFCTNFVILFFPLYLMFRGLAKRCGANTETIGDILQGFRDRGFTFGRYINRCVTFCILWVLATYLYMRSFNELMTTDVIALFATNVASVYLLSWVILHEQFVGVRVSRSSPMSRNSLNVSLRRLLL